MMAILKAKNIHSYSFTPKELKQESLILRGLYINSDTDEIKAEIDNLIPDTLLNQTIIWEKPIKKDGEIQCHRCQQWGHTAKNCNSSYKCVKCDQQHIPGECKRIRSDTTDPYCINCQELGHPDNWRGRPIYKKYLANRQKQIQKVQVQKSAVKNNVSKAVCMISPGRSFAHLFQSHYEQRKNPHLLNSS